MSSDGLLGGISIFRSEAMQGPCAWIRGRRRSQGRGKHSLRSPCPGFESFRDLLKAGDTPVHLLEAFGGCTASIPLQHFPEALTRSCAQGTPQ